MTDSSDARDLSIKNGGVRFQPDRPPAPSGPFDALRSTTRPRMSPAFEALGKPGVVADHQKK
jgi:hypothetical protein